MKKTRFILCLPLLLLASCATDDSASEDKARPAQTKKSLTQRFEGETGYQQDSEGNWAPRTDKRSSFETNRESAYFKGGYEKKDFKTAAFQKKSWWGDTKYESKKFEGDTDGSRFQTTSKFQRQGARESNTSATLPGNYNTSRYSTTSASEQGSQRFGRPSDAETDVRRRVYTAPSVIDWREQRAMSVGQTKGILGR